MNTLTKPRRLEKFEGKGRNVWGLDHINDPTNLEHHQAKQNKTKVE